MICGYINIVCIHALCFEHCIIRHASLTISLMFILVSFCRCVVICTVFVYIRYVLNIALSDMPAYGFFIDVQM